MRKIIATGKGGAGKTTIVATLSRLLARQGFSVMVIDTDPSMNLAMSLGVPFSTVRTLAEDKKEIHEQFYEDDFDGEEEGHTHSSNINIDAFLEKYQVTAKDDVKVVVMGTISEGGGGCICSYISIVKRLIDYLALWSDQYDIVIVDSQAGSEILGRGLAVNYDHNLVIAESFPKSMEVARHVLKLARDLNIKRQLVVVNKIRDGKELELVADELCLNGERTYPVRYDEKVIEADRMGSLILDMAPDSPVLEDIRNIMNVITADYEKD
ncbi:MAG: ArsA-related P-loop ATPase [Methanolobus sp.]|uniref:ATP-binding protein n=1 Tax=Methanolobus sp. TaxID=1874737 RepID=UPI00273030A7|nr:ArsA-related P-loop ATPase [Methanolobus sp.]MDP2216797.1 ArsA-related P-loop ATPase [Methanolobus sp.]